MQISEPCIITPRLLPGVRVGSAFISIEYASRTHDGRQKYRYFIDIKGKKSHSGDDLSSGVGGGDLNEGLASLLSFLGACAESVNWERRTGKKGESDNAKLFPPRVAEWAARHEDELSMLQIEIEEGGRCIAE